MSNEPSEAVRLRASLLSGLRRRDMFAELPLADVRERDDQAELVLEDGNTVGIGSPFELVELGADRVRDVVLEQTAAHGAAVQLPSPRSPADWIAEVGVITAIVLLDREGT